MPISAVAPSDLLIISLPPGLYKEILAGIEKEIPCGDLNIKHIGMAFDSNSAMGGLCEVIVEVINSKAACAAIAAVLCQWIRSRNGKKVRIWSRGKTIELTGLSSKEVSKFIEEHSGERTVVREIK